MQATAYGLVVCGYNFALIVVPVIMGKIHDLTLGDDYYGYYWVGVAFLFLMLLSTVLVTMLRVSKSFKAKVLTVIKEESNLKPIC